MSGMPCDIKAVLILLAQPVKEFSHTVAFVSLAVFIPASSYWCGGHALSCSVLAHVLVFCKLQNVLPGIESKILHGKLSGNKNPGTIKCFI